MLVNAKQLSNINEIDSEEPDPLSEKEAQTSDDGSIPAPHSKPSRRNQQGSACRRLKIVSKAKPAASSKRPGPGPARTGRTTYRAIPQRVNRSIGVDFYDFQGFPTISNDFASCFRSRSLAISGTTLTTLLNVHLSLALAPPVIRYAARQQSTSAQTPAS